MPSPILSLRPLAALCLALVLSPAAPGATAAEEPLTREQETALAALDGDLARLDEVVARITDSSLRQTALEFVAGFKRTRETLGQKFDQGKYDELKFEAIAEFQRLNLWLRPRRALPAEQSAALDRVVFQLEPAANDPAGIKAALAAVDEEIGRLARMHDGRAPGALASARRLRAGLGRNFSASGWGELMVQLKDAAKPPAKTVNP